jgi:hypothetical protein
MFHHPSREQYEAEPPRAVSLVTMASISKVLAQVQLPPHQIATLEEVKRQARLKWGSLPLDQQLAGVAVCAISDAGEVLFAYALEEFACELFQVRVLIFGVHIPRAKCLLRMRG